MKKIILALLAIGFTTVLYAQEKAHPQWADFESTVNAKENSKFTMVFVYQETPCSFCPVAEEILADSTVLKALKKDFICTKFDAQTQKEVQFNGITCIYNGTPGVDGINIAAIILLDGKMGFPSFVFFDKNNEKLGVHFAPKTTNEFLMILDYYTTKEYLKTPYEEWVKTKTTH